MRTHRDRDEPYGYLKYLGLRSCPFPVAPDDANFFISDTIEEIVAEIVHGVCTRKGFILLTGEVGLGKTTISRHIMAILRSKQVTTSLVLHTSLKEAELLQAIVSDFGIRTDPSKEGMGAQMKRLYDFLLSRHAAGKNCAIIIDDAQNMDRASLELIRMISNLEANQQKLVQILLIGQTELAATLCSASLRQLNSRIVIRKVVRSLSRDELRNYILFKLHAAGSNGRIGVTEPAFRKLYRKTRGNFRRLNLLMDRCLYAICTQGASHCITRKTVDLATVDLSADGPKARKRLTALAASLMIPLMLIGGAWIAHSYTGRNSLADSTAPVLGYKVPPCNASVAAGGRTESASGKIKQPENTSTPQDLDPAVAAFLGIHRLDRYARQFQDAVERGNLEGLSRRIYVQSGYQLVQLPTMSDSIRRRYGALAFTLKPGQSPTWLLFWRPRLTLKHFFFNYQGEDILDLQKLFSDLHLYDDDPDGIVGTRLMKAVISFQKTTGLPVTGFPDAATVFKLCHQKEWGADA